jgi:hypothetical protein
LPVSLSLAGRLVGILGAIVQIAVLPMFHTGQDLPLGRAITRPLIREHDTRHIHQALEQLADERLGSLCVPTTLDQNVEDVAVLIHGPPEIMALPIDGGKDFVHLPAKAR